MILTIPDFEKYYECSRPTAYQRRNEIVKYFAIKSKRVHIHHLCDYEGETIRDVINKIHPIRPKV